MMKKRPLRLASGATYVYASPTSMIYPPGDRIVFHAKGRHLFPRYVADEAVSARVGYPAARREGHEKGWTVCGRLVMETKDDDRLNGTKYEGTERFIDYMKPLRLDHALLLGRPCKDCWETNDVG